MADAKDIMQQNVLAALNKLTLVGGAAVATDPIAADLGISPDELHHALAALLQRGFIAGSAATATITPDGHASLV